MEEFMGATPKNISASRGAAVLGMSEWSTQVETWLKIMKEREPGFCEANGYTFPVWEDSAPTRWGLAFEDAICGLVKNKGWGDIYDREKEFELESHPFITCHIDGRLESKFHLADRLEAIVENKTTNIRSYRDKWGEPGTDHIPGIYQIQVQHQMMCTGMDDCIVNVLVFPKMVDEWEADEQALIGDFDTMDWAIILDQMGYFHQYPVKANKELQDKMLEGYVKFWENHVLTGVPPEPKTYEDVKRLVKDPKGTIVASDQVWRWKKEYDDITVEISSANKRKADLKVRILNFMVDGAPHPIDDESVEKWILRSPDGRKIAGWDGKRFR
jgi:predicted phage-related endonuclease